MARDPDRPWRCIVKAMTLRLSDEMHESLRKEAFERRVPMTAIITDAIEHRRINGSLGCDVCGEPKVVHVSTPGGFRFCGEHWHPAKQEPQGHDTTTKEKSDD